MKFALPMGLLITCLVLLSAVLAEAAVTPAPAFCVGVTPEGKNICHLDDNQVRALITPTVPAGPSPVPTQAPPTGTVSGHILIENQNNVIVDARRVTTTSGNCITVRNSSNVTIKNSNIGPCGGNAIHVLNSPDVKVVDNYIHPERASTTDNANGVWVVTSARTLVQGNVIEKGASNVIVMGSSQTLVKGNYIRNPSGHFPRGTQISVWSFGSARSTDVRIEQNYLHSDVTTQTDGIGIGFADRTVISGNYVTGGRFPSGCAILGADHSAQATQVLNNTLMDTGGCGIGLGNGSNHVIRGNKVYNRPHSYVHGAGNTAIYAWNQYPGTCSNITVDGNTAVQVHPSGYHSGWWYGNNCNPTNVTASNVWNQPAVTALDPPDSKMPPPASIPPVPFAVKVSSPYTR